MNLTVQSPSGLLKRTYSKSSQNDEPPNKIPALDWYYKLETDNSQNRDDSDNDTESVYSIQDKETDFVKDTTDLDTSDSDYTDDTNVEFEVASMSEVDDHVQSFWAGVDLNSSSGTDDVLSAEVIAAIQTENIDDILSSAGTEYEAEDDVDNSCLSVPRKPKITLCTQCKGPNDNPSFHYCKKCYQVRKAIFPPRPRRVRSRNQTNSGISSSQESPQLIEPEKVHSFFKCSQDSGMGSSSQESCAISSLDLDKIVVPDELVKEEKQSQNKSSKLIENPDMDDDKCIMCTEQPKNGVFVHGSIGHMCCCYKCAVKTWTRTKRCPICSCKVKNVLKVFAR